MNDNKCPVGEGRQRLAAAGYTYVTAAQHPKFETWIFSRSGRYEMVPYADASKDYFVESAVAEIMAKQH